MSKILRVLIFAMGALGASVGPAHSWVPSGSPANYRLEQDAQLGSEQREDMTLRQVVRLSIGGKRIRILLTNTDGDGPLSIEAVHVALAGPPGSPEIEPGTDHEVRFGGRSGISISAGATVRSDAINMRVSDLTRLSISLHIKQAPALQTGHLRSLSTSWIAAGNQASAQTLTNATSFAHWFDLGGVEVESRAARVVVALGDSITDGSLSTVDGNRRWPDILAERLIAAPGMGRWAVANKGVAGNRLLAYGRGPSALARFDKDVLALPNVRTVILLEGVNDLGQFAKVTQDPAAHREMVGRIISAYDQLIARAHARALRIVGGTIMPDAGSDYSPTALDDQDRQTINEWIRAPGHFDAVIDWDALMRDPNDPGRLNPAYDSGDHIHPSSAGYRVMAYAIPLAELTK